MLFTMSIGLYKHEKSKRYKMFYNFIWLYSLFNEKL